MRRLRLFLFCVRRRMPWRLAWVFAGVLDRAAVGGDIRILEIHREPLVRK